MPFLARIILAAILTCASNLALAWVLPDLGMWPSEWLSVLSFLLYYRLLDSKFGRRLKCRTCGKNDIRRGLIRCPACRHSLIPRRTSILQIVSAILVLVLWGNLTGPIWFYSTSRYYFYVGQNRIGLDRGIHYNLGFGVRDYIPGFSYNVFHFDFSDLFTIIVVPVIAWNILILAGFPWHKRRDPIICPCGYNLTGNVSGICPECGNPVINRTFWEQPQ